MIRTFGPQTLTGAAQPWFSDVTTAPTAAPVNSQNVRVTVANTAIYQVGDRIIIAPGTATQNILKVNKIISGTVLQCQSESDAKVFAIASGAIIMLAIACWEITLQNPGTAVVVLGTDATVTAVPGGSAFFELLPAGANAANVFQYAKSTGQNPLNTAEGWMIGTAAQKMLVSAFVN